MNTGPRSRQRRRHLSADELDLWRQVTRTVSPMRVSPAAESMVDADLGITAVAPEPRGRKAPKPEVVAEEPKKAPARRLVAPLMQIEPRLRQRLRRGRTDIDRAIDLHGLRQEEAHRRLHGFLAECQRDGVKLVLVITGKGRGAEDAYEEPYGVLRRAVPNWLREPAIRGMVIGFEEATATHGGAGALYVRVRRRDRGRPGGAR